MAEPTGADGLGPPTGPTEAPTGRGVRPDRLPEVTGASCTGWNAAEAAASW